uniref:Uncharacterized protein n=1 Tax=Opuntia streptacantha TaxID=393608 RepID=A0A7C8YVI2_OPUST
MYYFCFQLSDFYCINFTESCTCLFDKLLHALLGFDLSSNFQLDMEWPMLHEPIPELILEGYSLDVLLYLTWYNHSFLSSLFLLCSLYTFIILFSFYFLLSLGVISFFFHFASSFTFRILSHYFCVSFFFHFTSSFSFRILFRYFYVFFHPNEDIV